MNEWSTTVKTIATAGIAGAVLAGVLYAANEYYNPQNERRWEYYSGPNAHGRSYNDNDRSQEFWGQNQYSRDSTREADELSEEKRKKLNKLREVRKKELEEQRRREEEAERKRNEKLESMLDSFDDVFDSEIGVKTRTGFLDNDFDDWNRSTQKQKMKKDFRNKQMAQHKENRDKKEMIKANQETDELEINIVECSIEKKSDSQELDNTVFSIQEILPEESQKTESKDVGTIPKSFTKKRRIKDKLKEREREDKRKINFAPNFCDDDIVYQDFCDYSNFAIYAEKQLVGQLFGTEHHAQYQKFKVDKDIIKRNQETNKLKADQQKSGISKNVLDKKIYSQESLLSAIINLDVDNKYCLAIGLRLIKKNKKKKIDLQELEIAICDLKQKNELSNVNEGKKNFGKKIKKQKTGKIATKQSKKQLRKQEPRQEQKLEAPKLLAFSFDPKKFVCQESLLRVIINVNMRNTYTMAESLKKIKKNKKKILTPVQEVSQENKLPEITNKLLTSVEKRVKKEESQENKEPETNELSTIVKKKVKKPKTEAQIAARKLRKELRKQKFNEDRRLETMKSFPNYNFFSEAQIAAQKLQEELRKQKSNEDMRLEAMKRFPNYNFYFYM